LLNRKAAPAHTKPTPVDVEPLISAATSLGSVAAKAVAAPAPATGGSVAVAKAGPQIAAFGSSLL
jgi:hypothetical protein